MLSAFLALIESESDKLKFEQIYEKYKSLIYNIAYKHLNDYHLAQDATQEVLLHIAECIHKFDDVYSNETVGLVSLIAKCVAVRKYKKANRLALEPLETCADICVCEDFDKNIATEYILTKVKELDEKYSEILTLKCRFNFSEQEIAKILDLNLNTVKSRIRRARYLLSEKLNAEQVYTISTKTKQ